MKTQRNTFTFYGKEYTIPNVGDYCWVSFSNFDSYVGLITKVDISTPKFEYTLEILKQKGMTYGCYSPIAFKSKGDFEKTGYTKKINPKDRKYPTTIQILELED